MGKSQLSFVIVLSMPLLMGARGDGCAANSKSPAPDINGDWSISYDDNFSIEVTLGGKTYTEETGANGGMITITHEGQPISFDLSCEREDILCPSEAWPKTISARQENDKFEHRMIVNLPIQKCDGTLNEPPPEQCGAGTLNEECDAVCDGNLSIINRDVFGVIGEAGESFRLYLGAGIASNGVNCVVAAASFADANLENTGAADDGDWTAQVMKDGEVSVIYSGGCAWAGDTNDDGSVEALVAGAKITIKTGFSGARK